MSPVKVVGIIKRAMHWRRCSFCALGGSGEIVKPLFFFFWLGAGVSCGTDGFHLR